MDQILAMTATPLKIVPRVAAGRRRGWSLLEVLLASAILAGVFGTLGAFLRMAADLGSRVGETGHGWALMGTVTLALQDLGWEYWTELSPGEHARLVGLPDGSLVPVSGFARSGQAGPWAKAGRPVELEVTRLSLARLGGDPSAALLLEVVCRSGSLGSQGVVPPPFRVIIRP